MPAFLDSRDLRLVVGAVSIMTVLLALTYIVVPAPAQQSIGYPSSYSTAWGGAEAAFLLLQEQGYHAERWEESPEDLPAPPDGAVLVLAEPFETASPSEVAAIRRFVTGGGRALAAGAAAAALVSDADASSADRWDPQSRSYSALLPSPFSRDAPEITMTAPDTWNSSAQTWLPLYGQDNKVVAVSYRVGRGSVIWWASASPLTNGSIREKNNLDLLLNSVGASSTSRILWDEYFHGARGSLASYFEKTPLPWAGLQIALAFVAILLTFSRRTGPMRMPATDSRLSPLEFVDTLGDLYQSAHASPAAVSIAYRRFRYVLSRKLTLPAKAKLPDLCRAVAGRFGWPETSLLDTLSRSERAMRSLNLDEREALDLIRQLHEYSARLEPQGHIEQETPAWR